MTSETGQPKDQKRLARIQFLLQELHETHGIDLAQDEGLQDDRSGRNVETPSYESEERMLGGCNGETPSFEDEERMLAMANDFFAVKNPGYHAVGARLRRKAY